MMMMMRKDGDDDDDDDEEEDDGDDGSWGLLAGVCLKYTSLPSSTEVTCVREFVINTPLAFLDHYERFWKKRISLISTFTTIHSKKKDQPQKCPFP